MKLPKYVIPALSVVIMATFLWQMILILMGHPMPYPWTSALTAAFGWAVVALKDWKAARAETQPATE